MTNIGEIIFIFGLVRLVISFVNWLEQLYLINKSQETTLPNPAYSVSVLIPARNEENNIGNLLADLLTFRQQPLEIIVYDDLSTDNTSAIVRMFASRHAHIKLLHGTAPPDGWLGKNYACHQLSQAARGSKLLFLDADVRIKPGLIERTCNYMYRHSLKLLSIFPVQDMPDRGTRLAVPLMNWILLSLLALPLIRITNMPSFTAANGQFLLFDAATYKELMPHLLCKSNRVEDIAIMKEYKRKKLKVATLAGTGDIHCTMYHSLTEAVDGFSKNVFQFFGGSIVLTYLFAVVTTLAPFYLFWVNGVTIGIIYLVIVLLIRIFVSLTSRQSIWQNILLLVPQQLIFWRIILSATIKRKQKKLIWKDRNISTVQ